MNHFSTCRRCSILYCCTLMTVLVGCAGVPVVDWEHGARRGKIIELIDNDMPAASLPLCLAALAPEALAGRHFVKVQRFRLRAVRTEIAELADGVPARVGMAVELYPGDCAAGKPGRVLRALPPE